VYSLDYSHGAGTVLASGGADETVKLWDVSQSALNEANGGEAGAVKAENKASAAARKPPMTSLRTKSTPVFNVQFTGRNLLMAMGARAPSVRYQAAA
jgi:transcription initiation factor TFIID subunit 5